jgi:hypothetical protein
MEFKDGDHWVKGKTNQRITLYNYELWKDYDGPLFFVEGEKCVGCLEDLGLMATTNFGGSKAWDSSYAKHLEGRELIILPDNDKPGRELAKQVYKSLTNKDKVKVVELPGLKDKDDIHDWLNEGGTKDTLLELVKNAPSSHEIISLWDNSQGSPNFKPVICLGDVQSQEITYLWEPYIPMKKLTIVEGDPGIGKSWLTLELSAQVSIGGRLPGTGLGEPGKVLLLTAEDDPADTQKPRLEKLGANTKNIFVHPQPEYLDDKGLAFVEYHLQILKPKLLIIDPLQCYLGSKDMNKANETRSLLAPLAELASKYNCAVLIVRHLKKGADKSIYRGMGSIDILAAARSVLLVGCNQSNKEERAIIHSKCNIAKRGPTQGYQVVDGVFKWTGQSDLTECDLLQSDVTAKVKTESAVEEAEEFLLTLLKKDDAPSSQVFKEGAELGISKSAIKRAKSRLGIKSEKIGNIWLFRLEGDQEAQGSNQKLLSLLNP